MNLTSVTDQGWIDTLLTWVLSGPETDQRETKRVSGKMVGKALETVCAFANTQGGWLVLGVEDAAKAQGPQRLYGIAENPEAVDELLRKVITHVLPAVEGLRAVRVPCTLRDGNEGFLVALYVPASATVHSILDDGTWTRGQRSNREMTASEITELSYRRGVRSAESEPVDVDFELLETDTWRLYLRGRGLAPTGIADQLYRAGLAKRLAASCGLCALPSCCLLTNRARCWRRPARGRMCASSIIRATLSFLAQCPISRSHRRLFLGRYTV